MNHEMNQKRIRECLEEAQEIQINLMRASLHMKNLGMLTRNTDYPDKVNKMELEVESFCERVEKLIKYYSKYRHCE